MNVLAKAIWQVNEIRTWKEGIQLSLFANDMIVYVENSKESTKNY